VVGEGHRRHRLPRRKVIVLEGALAITFESRTSVVSQGGGVDQLVIARDRLGYLGFVSDFYVPSRKCSTAHIFP
jgi:hypothetical protein